MTIDLHRAGTIRSNLLRIVIGALVPMVLLGAWQGLLTYRDSRGLVAERLRANAWAIAENERDPFIIARHALRMASQNRAVQEIGPSCSTMLDEARDGATGILNFLRTDRTGRVRCSGLSFDPEENLSGRRWWREARTTSAFIVGEPQIGEVSRRPVVVLALALSAPDGSFDGTVSAGISLERLSASLAAKQAELGGIVMLVDRTGRVLLSSGAERLKRIPGVDAARTEPQNVTGPRGNDWIYVAAPLFGDDLQVVYAEPCASFTGAALSRVWLVLALPLLAALLSLAAVWFASQRYLLDWFPRLHALTGRIAQGRFDNDLHEFDTAPREIALMAGDLHAMAGSLDRHGRDLQTALDAQKALTRELNHRVRNNLQIVVSLLTMQAERADEGWVRDLLEQARIRVSALGLIHRLLYEQREEHIGEVGMATLFGDLAAQLRSANRRSRGIGLETVVDDFSLDFDRAVPLMLFAVEAVTNAYRHAFAEVGNGRIVMTLSLVDWDRVRLEVRDNGMGMTDPHAEAGSGLELLDAFAAQLGGTLTFADAAPGTVVTLDFPYESPAALAADPAGPGQGNRPG